MPHEVRRASVELFGEKRDFQLAEPSAHDYAMLEELSFVRREAQIEAVQAYDDWSDEPSPEHWWVYIAAQDRADAAQDELANWARQLAA